MKLIEMGHLNQSGPNLIGVKSMPVSIHKGVCLTMSCNPKWSGPGFSDYTTVRPGFSDYTSNTAVNLGTFYGDLKPLT